MTDTDIPESSEISIKLFGPLARQLGRCELQIIPNGSCPTSRQLLAMLAEIEPKLRPAMSSLRLAVNHGFAEDGQIVTPADEVALIGMVSGG